MANKILTFLDETKAELKKVTWPTREELVGSTSVVLVVTALLALYIGFFDYICNIVIRLLIH